MMRNNLGHVNFNSCHILLPKFGELPMEVYALKVTMGFQQRSQSSNFTFPTPCCTSIWHLAQINNHVKGIMGSISLGKPMTTQHHQKSLLMISRRRLLLKHGTLSIFCREDIRFPSPQGFSQVQTWIVLGATIDTTTMQDNYCYNTSNHRLAIEIGRWSTLPIFRDIHCATFALLM